MKIGFLGNANNYPFLLANELKDKSDILFFVDVPKNIYLNRPESYFGELVTYPYPSGFIENFKINRTVNSYFPNLFSREVIAELNKCDAVIVNGYGHFYLPFLRKSIVSISVFSGSDLDVSCNWNIKRAVVSREKNHLKRIRKLITLYYAHNLLKKSVFRTNLISYFPKGLYPVADKILTDFKKGKPFERYEHMHLSVVGIDYVAPPKNKTVKIFNAARFVWKKPLPTYMTEADNKRNDVIIRGIAKFIKQTDCALDIHFVEKGVDLEATKQLLKELKIEKYITWHKNMTHSDFINMLASCDIVTDGVNRHVIGGGAFGMALGRPLIANAIPEVVKKITGVDSEICHAENEDDVYYWLTKLVFDKTYRENKGIASREYIMKYHNLTQEANYFFDFIQKKING